MRVEGAIVPQTSAGNFTREAWCQLVAIRPEFRRPPSRQVPNPFKRGELMEVKPAPDAAEVWFEERCVGSVSWSMSDEPLVNITIESEAMSLVLAWSAKLSGEFHPN